MSLRKINNLLIAFGLVLVVEHDGENFSHGLFRFSAEGDTRIYLARYKKLYADQA